jgi:uncharacterized protein
LAILEKQAGDAFSLAASGLADGPSPARLAFGSFFPSLTPLALDLAYISFLGLLLTMQWPSRLLNVLAPAGRMAFSNYLFHWMLPPILFPLLFGWWLPGIGPIERMIKVTAVFALMVIFSTWWLKRFRFGPFEWLWRSLTYWKLQPMRVERPQPAG